MFTGRRTGTMSALQQMAEHSVKFNTFYDSDSVVRREGNTFKTAKDIYDTHTANTLHHDKMSDTSPLRFGTRLSCLIFYCRSRE